MPFLAMPVERILRLLASVKLARDNPRVIAVTGSVGKTTTKEAIYTVLRRAFGDQVSMSRSNLNNEFGVPLSILGIESAPSRWQYPAALLRGAVTALSPMKPGKEPIRIQELGAEKPGDIASLVALLKPYLSVGVVTTVGPIHLNPGQFPSVGAIEEEKGRLVEDLPANGWAILNKDDPATKRMAKRTQARVIWFTDKGLDTAQEVARAVGKIFKLRPSEIEAALQSFQRPKGRMNILSGVKGSSLIDDTYNANPMSMELSLAELGAKQGRRVVVLGDMLELGSKERLYHQQVGKIARAKADVLVGVGRRSRWYQPTYHFSTPGEAASFLKKFVREGDIVLVKGSQSMRMELVSEALLASPDDASKLPRQTPAWKRKSFVQP